MMKIGKDHPMRRIWEHIDEYADWLNEPYNRTPAEGDLIAERINQEIKLYATEQVSLALKGEQWNTERRASSGTRSKNHEVSS